MAYAKSKSSNAKLWAALFVALVALLALAQAFKLFVSDLPLTQAGLLAAALALVLDASKRQ